MLSCSIWFSAPSFWMGGGLESCCVGRVYCADGAAQPASPIQCHADVTQLSSLMVGSTLSNISITDRD